MPAAASGHGDRRGSQRLRQIVGSEGIRRSRRRWRSSHDRRSPRPRALAPGARVARGVARQPVRSSSEFDAGVARASAHSGSILSGISEVFARLWLPVWRRRRCARSSFDGPGRPGRAALIARPWRVRQRRRFCRSWTPARSARRPQAFVGYSDLTSLLTFLMCQCGIVAFHGPIGRRSTGARRGGLRSRLVPGVTDRRRAAGRVGARQLAGDRGRRCARPAAGRHVDTIGGGGGHALRVCTVGRHDPVSRGRRRAAVSSRSDAHAAAASGALRACAGRASARFRGATSPAGLLTAQDVLADVLADFPGPVVVRLSDGPCRRPGDDAAAGRQARRLVAGDVEPAGLIEEAAVRMKSASDRRLRHGDGHAGGAAQAARLRRAGLGSGRLPADERVPGGGRHPRLRGYAPAHITSDLSLVVVGNAISRGNPELEDVLTRKIRYCSLPEAIREHFLWGARSIVIAGTHGKTTTTSLTGWLLTAGGRDPTVLVGGIARNFGDDGSSYRRRAGRDFVIEGDEYDSAFFDKTAKFLKYLPDIAVINNIEFDHADIYADLDAVQLAFRRLVLLVPRTRPAAARRRQRARAALAARCGLAGRDVRLRPSGATGVRLRPRGPPMAVRRFRVRHRDDYFGAFELPLLGAHNVRNALAGDRRRRTASASARRRSRTGCGRSPASSDGSRSSARAGGVTVYDDFAHHPTAVAETLGAVARRIRGAASGRSSSRDRHRRAGGSSSAISRVPSASRARTRR